MLNDKNVIAITGYNKPDLMFLYLEQLYRDETISDYKIRIYTEDGYDKEEDDVVNFFKNKNSNVDIFLHASPKHTSCPLIGFHNILKSYALAAQEAKDFVIIGEEDMLPTKDYIKFNKQCYDKFLSKYERIFCIAHKRRVEVEKQGDSEILIGDYQCTSPSCISVKTIKKYMNPFLYNPLLFFHPIEFYNVIFSNSRIHPNDHTHHDGAIERIIEHFNLFALKPDQARSMHVGLSGIFCKGNPPQGTFEERIKQWRELIKDGDKLRSLSNLPQDMVVTDPEGTIWENLYLDINRDKAKASSWWYDKENEFKKYIENERLHSGNL
jgi:hypothetical protein